MYQDLARAEDSRDLQRTEKPGHSSIAIIDDLESNRAFLEHLAWRQKGVGDVHCFASARDALRAFAKTPPDLVITDFHMPEMNAVAFLEVFRQQPEFEDVPVIVISTRNEAENRRRALLAGATDFLMVPFDPIEFQARTNNLLTLSLHQKSLRSQSLLLRSQLLETQSRSQETENRFTGIIDSVPALVFAVDETGNCVFANHFCFEWLGMPAESDARKVQFLADKVVARPKDREATSSASSPEEIRLTGRDGLEHDFLINPKTINGYARGGPLVVYSGIEITQLKETETSLRQAKEDAEAANRAKSAFLSNMTHEIRTPLNAIMGFSDVICRELHGPIGNEKYQSYLLDIQSSANHLLSILNEILDFSEIEAERSTITPTTFALGDCLRDVANMIEPQLRGYQNRLEIGETSDVTMNTDRRKLTQVLLNLLANANQASRDGTLYLGAKTHPDGTLSLFISDSGVGMDEQELSLAVTEFGRAMTSAFVSDRQSGTGLGLPISMRLIKLLGGELSIDSEKGQGTTVCVTLPRTTEPAALEATPYPDDEFRGGGPHNAPDIA